MIDTNTFLQVIITMNTLGLFGVVAVGMRMLHHMGRLNERFDLMWRHFKRTVLGVDDDESN